jgi:cell filamentation protein
MGIGGTKGQNPLRRSVSECRGGNGRLSRLLATIMALQAGQPVLDFSYLDENKNDYFAAIQTGLEDTGPMREMFKRVFHASQQEV